MLVLASASPRRRKILNRAAIPFSVRPADVDESGLAEQVPVEHVRRLAETKARTVWRKGELVLGADTVVEVDGLALGKPRDQEDAMRMLTLLSGRRHNTLTGICLLGPEHCRVTSERTVVQFRDLTQEEIETYVKSGEPLDKAGAYAIQGGASEFVTRIEGCYFNIVGLPIARVYQMLRPHFARRSGRLTRTDTQLPKRPFHLPEDIREGESPHQYLQRMTEVAARTIPPIPGKITTLCRKLLAVDDLLLGKPRWPSEAKIMLRILAGRKHTVLTSMCVVDSTGNSTNLEETNVQLIELSDKEIHDYVATGEPLAHFGAYSVEGVASKYIARIEGRFESIDGFSPSQHPQKKNLNSPWPHDRS